MMQMAGIKQGASFVEDRMIYIKLSSDRLAKCDDAEFGLIIVSAIQTVAEKSINIVAVGFESPFNLAMDPSSNRVDRSFVTINR